MYKQLKTKGNKGKWSVLLEHEILAIEQWCYTNKLAPPLCGNDCVINTVFSFLHIRVQDLQNTRHKCTQSCSEGKLSYTK